MLTAPPDPGASALRGFLVPLTDAPLDELVAVLRDACLRGGGFWLDPGIKGAGGSPVTHLFEIAVLGVTGLGRCADEAARSWRKAALATLEYDEATAASRVA